MHDQGNRRLSAGENKAQELANRGHGPEGVDKAPGEETSQDTEKVVAETQKGKNKVDGDPTKETDQPIERGQ